MTHQNQSIELSEAVQLLAENSNERGQTTANAGRCMQAV